MDTRKVPKVREAKDIMDIRTVENIKERLEWTNYELIVQTEVDETTFWQWDGC